MAKLSRDFSSGNLHPRENILGTGTLASNGAEVVINADGCSTVTVDLRGTFSLTVEVAGTIDGTNWTPIPVRPVTSQVYVLSIAGTTQGAWTGNCAGFRQVRARVTSFTSGSATTTLITGTSATELMMFPKASDLSVTNTGGSGAAVTLSLAAGGTGLFHYITRLLIQRIATAALTAAATPTTVTTTNLPGSRAFSFPADAALQGVIAQEVIEPVVPLRSSAANTATTIVCPITTSVIWRATADYYLAP